MVWFLLHLKKKYAQHEVHSMHKQGNGYKRMIVVESVGLLMYIVHCVGTISSNHSSVFTFKPNIIVELY